MREQLPLPSKPPYTAHLGNMSFDATEGDITDFFSGCSVTNVRIVEDKMDRKPKGFGYVEFATLDGLKKALDSNGSQFQGRNIRVSVAEPRKSTRRYSFSTPKVPANGKSWLQKRTALMPANLVIGLEKARCLNFQASGALRSVAASETEGALALEISTTFPKLAVIAETDADQRMSRATAGFETLAIGNVKVLSRLL